MKQEQEEREASCTHDHSLEQSLQRVQGKLKDQLLHEKRIVEKKVSTTKLVLKKALRRREEVAHRLNALLKQRAAQNKRLSKVSDTLTAVSTSRAKVNLIAETKRNETHASPPCALLFLEQCTVS